MIKSANKLTTINGQLPLLVINNLEHLIIRRDKMSRAYDAKQAALAAHPDNKEDAVDLFLGYIDCSEDDFKYEFNQSAEQYIFGE